MRKIYLLFFLILTGCAGSAPQPNYGRDLDSDVVREGMFRQQVESVLGVPAATEVLPASPVTPSRTVAIYRYQAPISQGRFVFKELTLVYERDVVLSKSFRERIQIASERQTRLTNDKVELK